MRPFSGSIVELESAFSIMVSEENLNLIKSFLSLYGLSAPDISIRSESKMSNNGISSAIHSSITSSSFDPEIVVVHFLALYPLTVSKASPSILLFED